MYKSPGPFAVMTVLAVLILAFMPSLAASETMGPRILFDEGHGQRFSADRSGELDLSGLASVFVQKGSTVITTHEQLSAGTLSGADVLVISGPFSPLSEQEIAAVMDFVGQGKSLAVMLHIGGPVVQLLLGLGVDVSNGVINEQKSMIGADPHNFQVSDLRKHQINRGLKKFSAYGVWAVMSFKDNSEIIAFTSPYAWVDLDGNGQLSAADAVQAFGVVVAGDLGKGRFAVFGDDAVFQNKFLTGDNLALARNLADWLTGR
jgi:hypothetical protein